MSKSTRLEQIDGYFHDIHFQVKPTPISIESKYKQLYDMLFGWYKDNEKESFDIIYEEAMRVYREDDDYKKASEEDVEYSAKRLLFNMLLDNVEWKRDEDFRADFAKTIAGICMSFDREVPDDIWSSDELNWGTIKESWLFFVGAKTIPPNGR